MIGGTWPRLGMPTLHLFPGITQMTLISGAQPTAQTIPREPKGHIPLCNKVKLSQTCLVLYRHRGSGFGSNWCGPRGTSTGNLHAESQYRMICVQKGCEKPESGERGGCGFSLPFSSCDSEILLPTGAVPAEAS